jgi:hypothetical protein
MATRDAKVSAIGAPPAVVSLNMGAQCTHSNEAIGIAAVAFVVAAALRDDIRVAVARRE